MTTATETVELVPALASTPRRWLPFAFSVVALFVVMPFIGDHTALLIGFFVLEGVVACVWRAVRVPQVLKQVTQPPADAVIGQRPRNWFVQEGIFVAVAVLLVVVGFTWAAYLLVFPSGDTFADVVEARRIDRFERQTGWRVLRSKEPAFVLKYFAVSQA